jgi:hypothetical protein
MLLKEQPGLVVMSNGAECVLIRKDLYLAHASDELLRQTRNEVKGGRGGGGESELRMSTFYVTVLARI